MPILIYKLSSVVLACVYLRRMYICCMCICFYIQLIVCGQAKSHCVKYTVESLMEYWDPAQLSDIILLTDGMCVHYVVLVLMNSVDVFMFFVCCNCAHHHSIACSSVSGCEEISKAFEEDFVKRGGTIATTSDVFNVIEKRKKNGWKSV